MAQGLGIQNNFYCLVVIAGFYSDVVECLPVDPATWDRLEYFRLRTKIHQVWLYD